MVFFVCLFFVFVPLTEYAFVLMHQRNFRKNFKAYSQYTLAGEPAFETAPFYHIVAAIEDIGDGRFESLITEKTFRSTKGLKSGIENASRNKKNPVEGRQDPNTQLERVDMYITPDNVLLCVLIVLFIIFNICYVVVYAYNN